MLGLGLGLEHNNNAMSNTIQNGLVAEYKMDTGTGQTLWNSKKSAMSVSNLVVNGDFSSGVSGWSVTNATGFTASNNEASFTPTANGVAIFAGFGGTIIGNKYYLSGYLRATSPLVKLSSGSGIIAHSGSGNYEKLSYMLTATATSHAFNVVDNRASGWDTVYLKQAFTLNLTALFGAGNEPTLAQCDILFSTWHDGTKVMDLPSFNGQLGSTTAVDTNDPTWTGGGLSFTTDDYVKLPYMINAEQDFTIYVVANIGASAPIASECLLSMGNNAVITQFMQLVRTTAGNLMIEIHNDANVAVYPQIAPISGVRLFVGRRKNGVITLKDVISGTSVSITMPTSPITLNQISLGVLLRTNTFAFSNQPEYYASFYTRATTDAEDVRNMRAIKKLLAKRGVILG